VKTICKTLTVLALALTAATPVLADDITADVLTYNDKTKVATAKGNVVIHANQGAEITGANGEYHFKDRSAFLKGGVKYVKESQTVTADSMYLYKDRTARGIGSVVMHDSAENRTLKGDDVMYNTDTGYSKINGNGWLETPDGVVQAPLIEGNLKQVKIVASGGVTLNSPAHKTTGRSNSAVYTRTGRNGKDGKVVMRGNAHVDQDGNTFDGPELILRDQDKVVESRQRSTIVITNTEGMSVSSGGGNESSQEPVTTDSAIAGKPSLDSEAAKPSQSSNAPNVTISPTETKDETEIEGAKAAETEKEESP